jgi:hypothetical protein
VRVGHISLPSATVGDQWEHEAVRRVIEESGAEAEDVRRFLIEFLSG